MNTDIQVDLNGESYEEMFYIDLVSIANQRGIKVVDTDNSATLIGKLRLYDLELLKNLEEIPLLPDME